MKKIRIADILETSHSLMNDVVIGTAEILKDAYFVVKLDDLLKERGMTQKELAQMTGMRVGTISEFVNGKGISLNKVQILAMMAALRITNLHEMFEVLLPEELGKSFEKEKAEWVDDQKLPVSVKEMYRENVLKATGLHQ